MNAPTRTPELRMADRVLAALPKLTEAGAAAHEALERGDIAEALVHCQAAKAECSSLWSTFDEIERLLTARAHGDRIVADIEAGLARGGR